MLHVHEQEPIAYSIDGAIRLTGVARNAIFKALNAGELVGRRVGRDTIITHDDLQRWIVSRPLRKTAERLQANPATTPASHVGARAMACERRANAA